MYHPTYAENAKASIRFKERRVAVVMAMLIHGTSFVGMTEIEKLQRARKKLIDLFFADFARGEQFVPIEVRESAIRHPGRQKFPQAAGLNGSQISDFLEHRALKGVPKDTGIKQLAELNASPALDQHRAKKAQSVPLQLKSAGCFFSMHSKALGYEFLGPISCKYERVNRKNWNCYAGPAHQSWATPNR